MFSEASRELWYALQVRSRWERSTSVVLSGKGYQTMLPTYRTQRRQGRRERESLSPLFPGYVFCRFDLSCRLPILVTPGVISIIGQGRVPTPVSPDEIEAVQLLVSRDLPAQPWPYLEIGQRVRIGTGALQGVEGILLGFKGQLRIVISVSLLRRSVAIQVDRASVIPVHPAEEKLAPSLRPCAVLQGATS